MQLDFVSRFESGFALLDTDIEDLRVLTTATGTYLYSATGVNGGLTTWQLSATGASPVVTSTAYFTPLMHWMGPLDLEFVTLGSQTRVVVGVSQGGDLYGYRTLDTGIGSSSTLRLDDTASPGLQWGIEATTLSNGANVLYMADAETGTTTGYRTNSDGTVSLIGTWGAPGGVPKLGPVLLETVQVSGASFLLRADAELQGVACYTIGTTGALTLTASFGTDEGLGVNMPSTLSTVTAFGTTFVLLGAAESGTISVMRLSETGVLYPTDHILDTLDTRFAGITALKTAVVDGRVYIVAGGADDGLTLFTLLPDGRLVHLQTLVQQNGYGLENVQSIALAHLGDALQIYVASGAQAGLSRLTVDLSLQGATVNGATTGAAAINGTALDDLLISNSTGSDTLYGGDGNDVLVSGPGATFLHGGRGNDTFVMRPDSGRQTILDFQAGDRIDMTGLPMLNSVAQLTATPTATGILLEYLGFEIEVVARNGRPLALTDIWPTLNFAIPDRVMVLSNFPGDVITGSVGAELLEGSLGGDTISSGEGNDTIFGAEANDWVDGGAGNDVIDGGSGDDTLLGGDGNDWLSGAGGRDSLDGGLGDDTILGGTDSDTIFGGDGRDSLNGSDGANSIDGGAGNDSITGGVDADTIFGGADDDMINGGLGHNYLDGGTGNDTLFGGVDADTLMGGTGNDSLNGGGGAGPDYIDGGANDDTIWGSEGTDTLIGGAGNDAIIGGFTEADLRDLIYGGDGNDWINGGYGNDSLRGDDGADTIEGGFGTDTLVGGPGNDILGGSAWSDLIFGNDGDDFINGGFGCDRMNGGAGADQFFHLGVAGHGSDWIQDYVSAEGDVLVFGQPGATLDDFQVNIAETPRAGVEGVAEAFVIYRPTHQIIWALVDGSAQDHLTLRLAGHDYELLV